MKGWSWIRRHIAIKFILTPFGKTNIAYNEGGQIGYSDYYIFGIRIARIQKTTPWD